MMFNSFKRGTKVIKGRRVIKGSEMEREVDG